MRAIHIWAPGIKDSGGIQHYSACLVEALAALYPDAALRVHSKLDAPGFKLVRVPQASVSAYGGVASRFRTAAYAAGGLRHAWRERPELIITTHPHFAKALRYIRRFTGCAYAVCTHGVDVWGQMQGAFLESLKQARVLLPVSEFTREVMLREGGFDPALVRVVPDTFREQAFSPGPKPETLLRRYQLKPEQPVLLTVGRLAATEAYKGHDQIIAALPRLRQQCPEVKYLIAGRGDDEPRLRRCVAEHGQEDAVIFAGFVPDDELADHYRLCDAFVMPSTGEGFGIVYLEALASGRPCLVGNQDASPEAIGHGRLGFAVNPRSPEEIAEAVCKLLTGQHDKPWLKEPETLRREIIKLYGFEAFKRSLAESLKDILPV